MHQPFPPRFRRRSDYARLRKRSQRLIQEALCRTALACLILFASATAWGAGGSISGVVRDRTGGLIPGASLALVNSELKTKFNTDTDARGFYSFPALPVGRYDLTVEAHGFQMQKKSLVVDTDAALTVDVTLQISSETQTVTVTETEANVQTQVDTVATHLGEVVSATQIQAIPLNGRSTRICSRSSPV